MSPRLVYSIFLPSGSGQAIHPFRSCTSCSCAHLKYLVKCYVPDGAMGALGNPSQLFPPPPLGIHHSWMAEHIHSLILGIHHSWMAEHTHSLTLAFRAHSPLSRSSATEHHLGSRGNPAWVPAPPSQEGDFFPSVSPHPLLAVSASITTVRLEVIEARDEEKVLILSREAGKKCSKDKHPVELREK